MDFLTPINKGAVSVAGTGIEVNMLTILIAAITDGDFEMIASIF